MTSSKWPPKESDRPALLHAYVDLLGWTLFIGKSPLTPGKVKGLLVEDPSPSLTTPCTLFDSVEVPFDAGMAARSTTSEPCWKYLV
jgi:hypothetical protein